MSWHFSQRLLNEYMQAMRGPICSQAQGAGLLQQVVCGSLKGEDSTRPENRTEQDGVHAAGNEGWPPEDIRRTSPVRRRTKGNARSRHGDGSAFGSQAPSNGMRTSHQWHQNGQSSGEPGSDVACGALVLAQQGASENSGSRLKGALCVSSLSLPELVEAYSQAGCLVGEQSAPLSSTGTDVTVSLPVKTKGCLSRSLSGTTSRRSTDSNGEDVLTWYLAGFPVRRIPPRLEAATSLMIYGRKCGESWQRSLPGTYSRRTSHIGPLTLQPKTLSRWVTRPAAFPFPRQTWVATTFGHDIGYVHTPTTKANYAAASMQKWPACRAYVRVFGQPSPLIEEWLMDWPEGWSDTAPLATDKYRSWLQRHGAC